LLSEPQEINSCDTKSRGNATPNAANSGRANAERRGAGETVTGDTGSGDEDMEEAGVGRFGSIGYP
jgi:hypothetical protein